VLRREHLIAVLAIESLSGVAGLSPRKPQDFLSHDTNRERTRTKPLVDDKAIFTLHWSVLGLMDEIHQ
jgi:hypothetical protein